ncbi:anaerobic ribonucleoside-triphosphate reductase activating protein [Stutzerimonas nosocomialis]|uniref:Anaerobic ribonucleoside-triphosphate reductase activating protein n=1 Tax=Stutzerimonas nosocomialis TaxID=1056496 RepID=A0A5R9QC68_9GAMM|nr:anaerobic ribonucleoside-triphosphate reductase activating protein [Stutzerimonas nosocomialis]TLX62729.1 anaerobic ribonucleoside-triphosphate reductase activating protein [Stutzerimonas nosocomialis]
MAPALRVGGLVPLTTLDFPDHLACVFFCQGCGWRCRYCHNPQLIPACGTSELAWADLLGFLRERVGLLEAVVFSGGEPTLQHALPDAIEQVRALGYKVALHSAGIKPKLFRQVLPLVDWVGFDVKATPERSRSITGVPGSGEANWQSLLYLLDSGVAHECRTTVHWQLFEPDELWNMARRLRTLGVQRFAVQCVRTARMLDPDLADSRPPYDQQKLWERLDQLFPSFVLRG